MFQNEIEMVSRMESLSKNAKHIIENTGTYHYRNQRAKNGSAENSEHKDLSQLKFAHKETHVEFHQTKDRMKPAAHDSSAGHQGTVVPAGTKMSGEDVIIQEILHHRSTHQISSNTTAPNSPGRRPGNVKLFQTEKDQKETSKRKAGNEDSKRRPTLDSSPTKPAMENGKSQPEKQAQSPDKNSTHSNQNSNRRRTL